jgi:hypothetical protein
MPLSYQLMIFNEATEGYEALSGITYFNIFKFRLHTTGLTKLACIIRNYAGAAHWHYFEIEAVTSYQTADDIVATATTLLKEEIYSIEVGQIPIIITGVCDSLTTNTTGITVAQQNEVIEIVFEAYEVLIPHCSESPHNVEATLNSMAVATDILLDTT